MRHLRDHGIAWSYATYSDGYIHLIHHTQEKVDWYNDVLAVAPWPSSDSEESMKCCYRMIAQFSPDAHGKRLLIERNAISSYALES